MKKITVVMVGVLLCGAVYAENVLEIARINFRPATKAVFYEWQGGVSVGEVSPAPGFEWPESDMTASEVSLRLRWSGLTLDEKGNGDDFIDFTVTATGRNSSGSADVMWTGLGWGVGGGAFGLGDEEVIDFSISSIVANVGVATFEGFSGVSIHSPFKEKVCGTVKANEEVISFESFEGAWSLPEKSFKQAEVLSVEAVEVESSFFARNFDLVFSHSNPEKITLGFL